MDVRMRHAGAVVAGLVAFAALCACEGPFGIGLPSTRSLEQGARDSLSFNRYEMSGSYVEAGGQVSIDVQFDRPSNQKITVESSKVKLDAIILGDKAYYRGQEFLAAHIGSDPLSQNLAKAAGNAWWRGAPGAIPDMQDLTEADAFARTFLGPAVSTRTDHVVVDGVDAVDLAGRRADVYIAMADPHRLLGVRFDGTTSVDGIEQATLTYSNFGKDFGIVAPSDVIDFSNLSTLPPVYQVVSVDTSKCANPCLVSAVLKNLGGATGAKGPSTITFTLTASTNNAVLGSCSVQVVPDVDYNSTTTVLCTIANIVSSASAAIVTATADNPGRA